MLPEETSVKTKIMKMKDLSRNFQDQPNTPGQNKSRKILRNQISTPKTKNFSKTTSGFKEWSAIIECAMWKLGKHS